MDFKPKIEILIATMDRDNLDFLKPMFPFAMPKSVGLVIVNQSISQRITVKNAQVKVFNSTEKGLSRSRNLALENASAEICVFADDDVVFKPNFDKTILQAYAEWPESDFIRFSDKAAPKNFSWLDILNTTSIEMTVKRESIIRHGLKFDENFGLGSGLFEMGEEQLFLANLKKKGLILRACPIPVNSHHNPSSAEKKSVDERYFIQGAFISAIFEKKWRYWIGLKLTYALKQGKVKRREIKTALKAAKKGRQAYLKLRHEQIK